VVASAWVRESHDHRFIGGSCAAGIGSSSSGRSTVVRRPGDDMAAAAAGVWGVGSGDASGPGGSGGLSGVTKELAGGRWSRVSGHCKKGEGVDSSQCERDKHDRPLRHLFHGQAACCLCVSPPGTLRRAAGQPWLGSVHGQHLARLTGREKKSEVADENVYRIFRKIIGKTILQTVRKII